MNKEPRIPDAETSERLLKNLRLSRLKMEFATLELEEITAKLEQDTRQQRLKRLQQSIVFYEQKLEKESTSKDEK